LKIKIQVTNIKWNIKKQGTEKFLSIFYVELKPERNNMDIYEIRLLLHYKVIYYKVKFESPYLKMKFLNTVIVNGIATREVFASVKRDASSRI